MRNILIALRLSTACHADNVIHLPYPVRGGTVTAVDSSNRHFICFAVAPHYKYGNYMVFRTTRKTVFMVGNKPGSFEDLRESETVDVDYDGSFIATKVVIRD